MFSDKKESILCRFAATISGMFIDDGIKLVGCKLKKGHSGMHEMCAVSLLDEHELNILREWYCDTKEGSK